MNNRLLISICLLLAIVYHFLQYFGSYGPELLGSIIENSNAVMGLILCLILTVIYLITDWRQNLKGSITRIIFDLLMIWVFICILRSVEELNKHHEWKGFLLNYYLGPMMFPLLFFIFGLNIANFSLINKMLTAYCILTFILTLPFVTFEELMLFILMPVNYVLITYPFQSSKNKILLFLMSVLIVAITMTNRSGVLRILISWAILFSFYFLYKLRISKKLISIVIILVLLFPLYFLYEGVKGVNVFGKALGQEAQESYAQENLAADTRTFLYTEVFQDLHMNQAFLLGKGMNGGYLSESFETLSREMVEVGFLEILMKMGIVGFVLYMSVLIPAIFKAVNRSNSVFMQSLGLFLVGYYVMFFIENILALDLLNVVTWLVIGMCHSKELRELTDQEIRDLFVKNTMAIKPKPENEQLS